METVAVTPPPPLLVPASHTSSQNHKGREEFDASVSDEERRFYLKAYPNIDVVRDRKVHCTTCKCHIGTAPSQEDIIKMHPILRVTQCTKCHDFYNSGEFSKGEDGSELYCRWCGQGGEVYCCSSCPYVFCKSCIVKNLSRGVVADIEQNENWSCFNCSSKILWPLRAQHWALIKYIDKQRRAIKALNLPDAEERIQMAKDRSTCCRLAKAKCGNMSDSLESLESSASRRSVGSTNSAKRNLQKPPLTTSLKRLKTSNDEVVCTPDLLSMLEPDCQITMPGKPRPVQTPTASSPKIMSIQTNYGTSTQRSSLPPPLVLRNTSTQVRPIVPSPIVRRTVIGPRTPSPGGSTTPVYHTINGYRIDLNSAAQHETFRLPNGKLIQVKRQGAQQSPQNTNNWTQQRANISITQHNRPIQITPTVQQQQHYQTVTIQHNQQQQHQQTQQGHPPLIRYHNSAGGNSTGNISHNNTQIHMVNGTPVAPVQVAGSTAGTTTARPAMVRHVFPDTPIGMARTQLQEQVFNAMDICQHLTGKVQMLTNSNAYKQARNYLEVKELYIHLSYLLTYAIGRFKGLQDKCLGDMRQLGFVNDADSLENGQLAADKQASDDEDNEIEIVEPKTDTITLDSDNDDDEQPLIKHVKGDTTSITVVSTTSPSKNNANELSMSTSLLASLLEIDVNENDSNTAHSSPGGDGVQKKQPRKKTTNKPNPTLIKQKEMLERERLEEMKRSDVKLKMKCAIALRKAEEEYPFVKQILSEHVEKLSQQDNCQKSETDAENKEVQNAAHEVNENMINEVTTESTEKNVDDFEPMQKQTRAYLEQKENAADEMRNFSEMIEIMEISEEQLEKVDSIVQNVETADQNAVNFARESEHKAAQNLKIGNTNLDNDMETANNTTGKSNEKNEETATNVDISQKFETPVQVQAEDEDGDVDIIEPIEEEEESEYDANKVNIGDIEIEESNGVEQENNAMKSNLRNLTDLEETFAKQNSVPMDDHESEAQTTNSDIEDMELKTTTEAAEQYSNEMTHSDSKEDTNSEIKEANITQPAIKMTESESTEPDVSQRKWVESGCIKADVSEKAESESTISEDTESTENGYTKADVNEKAESESTIRDVTEKVEIESIKADVSEKVEIEYTKADVSEKIEIESTKADISEKDENELSKAEKEIDTNIYNPASSLRNGENQDIDIEKEIEGAVQKAADNVEIVNNKIHDGFEVHLSDIATPTHGTAEKQETTSASSQLVHDVNDSTVTEHKVRI